MPWPSWLDPCLRGLSGCGCDFKLNRALVLDLHNGGSGRHLVAMANVSHHEVHKVATMQFAINAQPDCPGHDRQFGPMKAMQINQPSPHGSGRPEPSRE